MESASLGLPVASGLRLGTLVELHGVGAGLDGMLGQLVSHSEKDGTCSVTLLDGATHEVRLASVRSPHGLARPGLGGGPASFDVLQGPRLRDEALSEELQACLFEKGFCVLRACSKVEEAREALRAVKELEERGRLQRLPEEVEEGYLGSGAKGKVVWMGSSDSQDLAKSEVLSRADDLLSKLAALVQPDCPNLVGKAVDERSPTLVSLSLREEEEDQFVAPQADDATLGTFFSIWRRTCVRVVQFLGPGTASVSLESNGEAAAEALPTRQETVELQAVPGTTIVFLSKAFNYRCSATEGEVLSLSSSILEHTTSLNLGDFVGDQQLLRGPSNGPAELKQGGVHVVNTATRLMAGWDEPQGYRAGLYGGGDAGVLIPFTRWQVSDYFAPDAATAQPWQTLTRHQAVVEGIELFDNKYFEVVQNEARVMDPMQRHVLEVGAKNLFKLGITKKTSNRNPHHAGCSVGLDKDDWDKMDDKPQGGSNVQAIISNRFSFIFNLRGPNFVADTACSASLCATHLAKYTLADRTNDVIEFHIALGIHQCLMPLTFIGASQAHMLSPIGRCLTFNASASGYMRGDGCSGMTLKYGTSNSLKDMTEAVWRGSATGQNGRSATLTAPNGLAQEDVIVKAMRDASVAAVESCVWMCHGTGTSLGDPIEVGAVRKVMLKMERTEPLVLTSIKSYIGHLEGGAAMTAMTKALLQVARCEVFSSLHLRQLNPNLEQAAFDAFYESECNRFTHDQGISHVSSFGFGGTNGHIIFWGKNMAAAPDITEQVLKRLRTMSPPEVRPIGDDPSEWESDLPELDTKPGDRYFVSIAAEGVTSVRWVKEASADEHEEDTSFAITGNFNSWEIEKMESTELPGQSVATVEVPLSGTLEFRFLQDEDPNKVLCPATPKCTRKAEEIIGPGEGLTNSWVIQAAARAEVRIELFRVRQRIGVVWFVK